ncbi:ribbon-helix-helix protein, CopG family [Halalkalicoccus salilacus]|uniref:ribbon-helix-helix protein, CopG family n=1 Tax=Halalkalicoccus TaxID=332246 RepID=UPI002F967CDD
MTDRVTVSLDEDARAALDALVHDTGEGQSEVVRRALAFYAANFEAATADAGANLEEYHQMLSSGEHVLLDVDFLHCFLEYVTDAEGDPNPDFLEEADRVSDYHAREYENRFSDLGELLDWLSFCGFLTVRRADDDTYHVVFPSESMKWFMTRFIERSTASLPFDLRIEPGVSKVLMTEVPSAE